MDGNKAFLVRLDFAAYEFLEGLDVANFLELFIF
jgi:hypothetical protein